MNRTPDLKLCADFDLFRVRIASHLGAGAAQVLEF
jgi:hypothetical protein